MKTALVTGKRGFVGRHMTQHLVDNGWDVFGCDVVSVFGMHGRSMLEYLHDHEASQYDLIIHAAAAGPNRRAIDLELANFPYNVQLDAALFEWATRTRAKHVVYLSSSAVYPQDLQRLTLARPIVENDVDPYQLDEPADVYGMTKLIGERMARQAQRAGIPVTIVRPFSGYGEDQSDDFPFRAFIERARRREDPFTIWGNAHQVRDFIHISDIVTAIMKLVELNVQMPVNLCTGRGTSMQELAHMVIDAVGYDPIIKVDENAPLGVMYRVGSTERLTQVYTPQITLEEGVARALMLMSWSKLDEPKGE